MDELKCKAFKSALAEEGEPKCVSIERFFVGNDDAASIGCNLIEHPGIDLFREKLIGLLERSDVNAVYVQIVEVDPGEGMWPFTDKVIVCGSIEINDLCIAVSALQPTDVSASREFQKLCKLHGGRSLVVWWD